MWTWLLFVSRPTAARCQLTGEQLEHAAATYDERHPESPRDDLAIDPEQDADDTDRPGQR